MNEENIVVSYGLISEINEKNGISHKYNTDKGSSGSLILSLKNNKLIGIYYGSSDKNEFNKGILIIYALIEFNKIENNKINEIIENKIINDKRTNTKIDAQINTNTKNK